MKNNECIILVQSVIENRNLCLFYNSAATMFVRNNTLAVISCKANLIGQLKASR